MSELHISVTRTRINSAVATYVAHAFIVNSAVETYVAHAFIYSQSLFKRTIAGSTVLERRGNATFICAVETATH